MRLQGSGIFKLGPKKNECKLVIRMGKVSGRENKYKDPG